jgi:hypothetical protein
MEIGPGGTGRSAVRAVGIPQEKVAIMPNLDLANQMIDECNVKFCNGSGNQSNHALDFGLDGRVQQMNSYRPRLLGMVPTGMITAHERAYSFGRALAHMPDVTVGNCGERSYWVYYRLCQLGIADVTVLTGAANNSINHDFVVIGANNVASGAYSQAVAPAWGGADIVICEPWFQSGSVSYARGIAYPLAAWPTWMPKIIAVTLKGKPHEHTLNRTNFHLIRNS